MDGKHLFDHGSGEIFTIKGKREKYKYTDQRILKIAIQINIIETFWMNIVIERTRYIMVYNDIIACGWDKIFI